MSQELTEKVARAIGAQPAYPYHDYPERCARAALAVVREDMEAAIQSTCDHASEHYKGNVALKIKRELLLKLRAISASPLGEQ